MKGMVPNTLAIFFGLFLTTVNAWPTLAQETTPEAEAAKPGQPAAEIRIGYLRAYEPELALSVLDVAPRD
ncbi:branched-chain amino acid ABC transporter substrate-binding protein, partial [Mesorhizobium sp. YM1C-6-2]